MGKILRLHLLDMSLSNCWTQGCKAIFISSINLCFCSQQQSHTIWKLSKTTDRCNKNKWLKLPEVKSYQRGNSNQSFLLQIAHLSELRLRKQFAGERWEWLPGGTTTLLQKGPGLGSTGIQTHPQCWQLPQC